MKIHGCQQARARSGAAGPPLVGKSPQRRSWQWGATVWIAVACLSLLAWTIGALGQEAKDAAIQEAENLNDQVFELFKQGQYEKAIPLAQNALELREKLLGPEHPDTAQSLFNLAAQFKAIANYTKAEPLYLRALQINDKTLGSTHPNTASSLNGLAALYRSMADYAKAEPLLQRSLEIREQALGPTHPDTAISLSNLAALYQSMGDYAKAEPLYQRALKISEQVLGPTHPNTAASLNRLAGLYDSMGDYAKAEPMFQRALQINEMALDPSRPDTAISLNNLAEHYQSMGDYAKAEPFLQRALKITEKALGPTHPDTAASLHNLAGHFDSMGDYAKAEPMFQRALQIGEKALGPSHPRTAASLICLARLYRLTGNYAKAEPLLQRGLKIMEQVLGPTHPYTATSLNNLAYLKIDQGQSQDAVLLVAALRWAEEKELSNILSFASERQRLVFQKSTYPYTLPATLGRGGELAETVLRQKGVVLDSLLEDRLAVEASNDPALRETIDQARSTRQQLSRLLMEAPKDFSPPARQRREVEKQTLTNQAEQLESTLTRQVTGFGRARHASGVKVEDVQAVLAKQEALIEFLRYDHYLGKGKFEPRYGAIMIAASGEPKWVPLGSAAEIEKGTALYQKSVRGQTDEATLAGVLKALHERVWQPIAQALPAGTTSVILSTDGDLSFVSFATLLGPDNQFLAQKYLIRYVSSGRDLLRTVPKPTDTRFVFFGNPDFRADLQTPAAPPDAAPLTAMRAVERGELGRLAFQPLPGTKQECMQLGEWARKERYQTELRLGAEATEQTLAAVQSPRVLHLATHGFFLPDPVGEKESPPMFGRSLDAMRPIGKLSNPMYRSGLVLAGAQRTLEAWARGETPPPESDGILTAEEVSALHLDGTWLVTLSACETGVGAARSGEGVLGLRRAFVQAGAQHLLMTLWPISDDTTVQIIDQFYTAAFTAADPGRGLAEVQRIWLEKLRKEKGLLYAVNRAGPFIVSSLGPTHAVPAAAAKPPAAATATPAPPTANIPSKATLPAKPPIVTPAKVPPKTEQALLCTAAAPAKFRYNYQFDDPGYRLWTRTGDTWEEKLPIGRVKRFHTTGRDTVDGRTGSILLLEGGPGFEVFVTDRQVPEPRIYFRQNEGGWKFVGKMEDIE